MYFEEVKKPGIDIALNIRSEEWGDRRFALTDKSRIMITTPAGNAIANKGLPRFHRDRLCSLKHLKSLHVFSEKPGQVPEKSGQVVLAYS